MELAHPEYLWLLLALPVLGFLFFLLLKWKRRTIRKLGDPALIHALINDYSPRKFAAKFFLFCSALVLCILALSGWQYPDKSKKITRSGSDIMIALDVSKSMLAQDLKPDRLERAKQLINILAQKSNDHRIGLVLFAGRAYLQMPLTWDVSALSMYLAAASPDNISTQGTVISDALKMCVAGFTSNENTFKSILLITDGEDHDENAVAEAKKIATSGIMINTVGIGTTNGAPITDEENGGFKKDNEGQTIISKLNENELRKIAQTGNGIYQFYTGSDEVADKILKQLNVKTFESKVNNKEYGAYFPIFQYFLVAAFLLLLIESFLSEKKRRKVAIGISKALLLFPLFLAMDGFSQSNSSIQKGNELYREKKFDKAIETYQKAIQSKENNSVVGFNLGNAFYKNGNNEQAINHYNDIIKRTTDEHLKQNAFYNKGVVLQKENKLNEAIEAYKNALLLNPNDQEARQNLQRILQQQKQQQPPPQKDKPDENKNKNDPSEEKEKQKQPQQNQSKLSKQDAEEKLKSLAEEEKKLQDKLNKTQSTVPNRPEKDW